MRNQTSIRIIIAAMVIISLGIASILWVNLSDSFSLQSHDQTQPFLLPQNDANQDEIALVKKGIKEPTIIQDIQTEDKIKQDLPQKESEPSLASQLRSSRGRGGGGSGGSISPQVQQQVNAAPQEKITVLLTIPADASLEEVKTQVESMGGQIGESFDVGGVISVSIPANKVEEVVKETKSDVSKDQEYSVLAIQPTATHNFTNFTQNNLSGNKVKVAILDTGIEATHIEFNQASIITYSTVGDNPQDYHGHGTQVSSAILSNSQIQGIAPKVTLMSVKVLDDRGRGTTSSIIKGINWAIKNNASIISLSFGSPTNQTDGPLKSALLDAIHKGVTVIAASGNCQQGCNQFKGVTFPGSIKEIITVGSVDDQDQLASFSSYQDLTNYSKPDVLAQGVNISAASISNSMVDVSGTSISTPIVTGLVAQMIQEVPKIRHEQVKRVLMDSAKKSQKIQEGIHQGNGIIDPRSAYEELLKVKKEINHSKFISNSSNQTGSEQNYSHKKYPVSIQSKLITSDFSNVSFLGIGPSNESINRSVNNSIASYSINNKTFTVQEIVFDDRLTLFDEVIKNLNLNNNTVFVDLGKFYIQLPNGLAWASNSSIYIFSKEDNRSLTEYSPILNTYSNHTSNKIKNDLGSTLDSFDIFEINDITVQATTTVYHSPSTKYMGDMVTFTAYGRFRSTTIMWVDGCEYPIGTGLPQRVSYSPTRVQFRCLLAHGDTGNKRWELKTRSGGSIMKSGYIYVSRSPSCDQKFTSYQCRSGNELWGTYQYSSCSTTQRLVEDCDSRDFTGAYAAPTCRDGHIKRARSVTDGYCSSYSNSCAQSSRTEYQIYQYCAHGCNYGSSTCNPDPTPKVTRVTPTNPKFGEYTRFTIEGQNLPTSTAYHIDVCTGLHPISRSSDKKQVVFGCTPEYNLSRQNIIVKEYADEGRGIAPIYYESKVYPYVNPSEYSVTPLDVDSNQDFIEFTVSGPYLPGNTAFEVDKCSKMEPLPGGSNTQRKYRCTNRKEVGISNARIKDHYDMPQYNYVGNQIKSLTINFIDNSPKVESISRTTTTLHETYDFEIKGTNLPSTLALHVPGCEDNLEKGDMYRYPGFSSTRHVFRCTQFHNPLINNPTDNQIIVKDRSGGIELLRTNHNFVIPKIPDLSIGYVSSSESTIIKGTSFDIEWEIKNIGNQDITNQFTSDVIVDGIKIHTCNLQGLTKGDSKICKVNGLAYNRDELSITFTADPNNQISESNEQNNQAVRTYILKNKDSQTQLYYPIKNAVKYNGKWDANGDGVRDFTTLYADNYLGFDSRYSGEGEGNHAGVDIPLTVGTPIYAMANGKVTHAQEIGGWGNIIVIKHTSQDTGLDSLGDIYSVYAHLSLLQVSVGENVFGNQQIGLSGNTGTSTGPHLHFQVEKNNAPHPYGSWFTIADQATTSQIKEYTCNPYLLIETKQCVGPKNPCPSTMDGRSRKCGCEYNSECPQNQYCTKELGLSLTTSYGTCTADSSVCGDGVCSLLENEQTCSKDCTTKKGRVSVRVADEDNNPISRAKVLLDGRSIGLKTNTIGEAFLEIAANKNHKVEVFCPGNEFCGSENVYLDEDEVDRLERHVGLTCSCDLSIVDSDGDGVPDVDEELMGLDPNDSGDNFNSAMVEFSTKEILEAMIHPGLSCLSTPLEIGINEVSSQEIQSIFKSSNKEVLSQIHSSNPEGIKDILVQGGLDKGDLTYSKEQISSLINKSIKTEYITVDNHIIYQITHEDGSYYVFAFYDECVGSAIGFFYGVGGGIKDDVVAVYEIAELVLWSIVNLPELDDKILYVYNHFEEIWDAVSQVFSNLGDIIGDIAYSRTIEIFGSGSQVAEFLGHDQGTKSYREFQWGFYKGWIIGYVSEQIAAGKGISSAIKSFKVGEKIQQLSSKAIEAIGKVRTKFGDEVAKGIIKLSYWDKFAELDDEIIEGISIIYKAKGKSWMSKINHDDAITYAKKIRDTKKHAIDLGGANCPGGNAECAATAVSRLIRTLDESAYTSQYILSNWDPATINGLAIASELVDDKLLTSWMARFGDTASEKVFKRLGSSKTKASQQRIINYFNILSDPQISRYADDAFFDALDKMDAGDVDIFRELILSAKNERTKEEIVEIIKRGNPTQLGHAELYLESSKIHYEVIEKVKFIEYNEGKIILDNILEESNIENAIRYSRNKDYTSFEEKVSRKILELIVEGDKDGLLPNPDLFWKKLDKDFNGFSYVVRNKDDLETIISSILNQEDYIVNLGKSKSYGMKEFLQENLQSTHSSNQDFQNYIQKGLNARGETHYRGIHFEMNGRNGEVFELKFQTYGQKAIAEFEHDYYKQPDLEKDQAIDGILIRDSLATKEGLSKQADEYFQYLYDEVHKFEFESNNNDFLLSDLQAIANRRVCPPLLRETGHCDFTESKLRNILDPSRTKTEKSSGVPAW